MNTKIAAALLALLLPADCFAGCPQIPLNEPSRPSSGTIAVQDAINSRLEWFKCRCQEPEIAAKPAQVVSELQKNIGKVGWDIVGLSRFSTEGKYSLTVAGEAARRYPDSLQEINKAKERKKIAASLLKIQESVLSLQHDAKESQRSVSEAFKSWEAASKAVLNAEAYAKSLELVLLISEKASIGKGGELLVELKEGTDYEKRRK